jgi:NOL1/NOP2/sun family putative RNA methylase
MDRYQPLIDNWDAFVDACKQDPVPTIRRNPLKATPQFEDQLMERFPDAEQAVWNPNVYRLPGIESPGKSLLHWRGEYYVQEASAAIPVTILAPQPGEDVLDMAAAPGGKTTQIAARMDNEGRLVANDANPKRLQSLFANIYRTGAACTMVTSYEGQNMPEDDTYDRILVDAPCSGEGNECRRTFEPADDRESSSLSNIQRQMMENAVSLLRPGGTLVYATCTFAPEENEGVVRHILDDTDIALDRIDIAAPHQTGVKTFENVEYGEEMRKTVRIFPHHMDSGGMFVAKFTK